MVIVPAFLVLAVWLIAQPLLIDRNVSASMIGPDVAQGTSLSLAMADVRRVVGGLDVAVARGVLNGDDVAALNAETTDIRDLLGDLGVAARADVTQSTLDVAQEYRALSSTGNLLQSGVVLSLIFNTINFLNV